MTEIIVSSNVKDYDNCIGETLRNRQGFPMGIIVDVALFTNHYNRSRVFFKLDNGRKIFADITDFANFKRSSISTKVVSRKADGNSLLWSSGLMNRNVNNCGIENNIDDDIELDKYDSSIGKSIYRDGMYVGIITSKEYDDFGPYYLVSNGSKIKIELQDEDKIIDISMIDGGN